MKLHYINLMPGCGGSGGISPKRLVPLATDADDGKLLSWSRTEKKPVFITGGGEGGAMESTQAAVENSATTDATTFVSPRRFWQGANKIATIAWEWTHKQTFDLAPRFQSVTASQYLKSDVNSDLTSVASIPATDITDDATHRFVADTDITAWNAILASANSHSDLNDTINLNLAKAYTDSSVVGLLDDRGGYDASVDTFPASGGSGGSGAILKGDLWFITVTGTLGGSVVAVGSSIRALTDTPGQTSANWGRINTGLGYTPENVTNKDTDGTLAANSDTKYASQKAAKTYSDTKLALAGGTLSGQLINSFNSAASTSALKHTGTWFSGGTATTTKPHILFEPTGATSTAWSTAGTGLGLNAASGFAGLMIDAQLNGVSKFKVGVDGSITTPNSGLLLTGSFNSAINAGYAISGVNIATLSSTTLKLGTTGFWTNIALIVGTSGELFNISSSVCTVSSPLTSTGLITGTSIKTDAPTGGTAKTWKFGETTVLGSPFLVSNITKELRVQTEDGLVLFIPCSSTSGGDTPA